MVLSGSVYLIYVLRKLTLYKGIEELRGMNENTFVIQKR